MHPSFVSRWTSSGGHLGPHCRRCEEQLRSANMVSTSPWRAANGTMLISMVGRTSMLLKSVHFDRAGGHGAAEALCKLCASCTGGQPW